MKTNFKRTISLLLALMLFLGATIDGVALADRLPDPGSAAAMSAAGAQIQAVPKDYGPFKNVTHTLTLDTGHEDLCKRAMTGELNFDWPEPSTYIDVVFVQDFSGSFDPTIAQVGNAVKTIVGSLNMGTDVDGVSPKDRAMIVTYQGNEAMAEILSGGWYSGLFYSQDMATYGSGSTSYRILNTPLATTPSTIINWVNAYYNANQTNGGTPTIDGMVEAKKRYSAATPTTHTFNKSSYKVNGQERHRKTVYLLITDGAANVAKWENLSAQARAKLAIKSGGYGYYASLNYSNFDSRPGGHGRTNSSVSTAYHWADERQGDNGAFFQATGYAPWTEAYEAMLIGMEDLATELRSNGGISNSSAAIVSAFWEDRNTLKGENKGFGQNWETKMFPTIVTSMKAMTGNNENYFVTSNTDIQDFSNKLIRAFKSASGEIEDQINITSVKGTVPKSFELFKKVGNEYVKVPPKVSSGIRDQVAHVDMENMEPGSYRIVYKIDESEYKSDAYAPEGITMVFEGEEFAIGTDTDGNIPLVPGNPRTDCDININKVVANNQSDYPNATEYKELEFRRQEFYFDSSYIFTSKVQDAKTSLIIEDKVDERLEVLDVFLVAGNDSAKADAVSGATPNNTLIASKNGTGGTPTISVTNNLVRYSLPQKPATIGGVTYPFGGYIGKNYVLVVKVRIKDSVTDAEISDMRNTLDPEDGRPIGIPNVAEIKLDGATIQSNKARAVPPELQLPAISKAIASNTDETWFPQYLNMGSKNETFRYRVQLEMPHDTTGYRQLVISDTLDSTLEPVLGVNNANVQLSYGTNAGEQTTIPSTDYTVTHDAATGKLQIALLDSTGQLFAPMGDKTLSVVFPAKIKSAADLTSKYNSGLHRIEIPNVATFQLNSFETRVSNQVLAIPPMPSVQLTKVDAADSNVKLAGAKFVLTDTTSGVTTPDRNFTTDAEGSVNVDGLVPGQTYSLKEVEAPEGYVFDEENQWTITVNAQGEVTVSGGPDNSVAGLAITALNSKPVTPTPTKWIKGETDDFVAGTLVLSKNDETVTTQIRVPIGSTAGFNSLRISDTLDEFIIPDQSSFHAFIEGTSTTVGGALTVEGRSISFTITSGFEALENKTLILEFKGTASQDLAAVAGKYSDLSIPNQASVSLNGGEEKVSNTVHAKLTSGQISLSKTVSNGGTPEPLSAGLQATFDLYRVVGQADSNAPGETDDIKVGNYTINGVNTGPASVTVSDLHPGTYYFVETSAPIGYGKTEGMAGGTFTVAPDGGVQTLTPISVDNVKTNDLTIAKWVKKLDGGTYSSEDYPIGLGEIWNYAIDIQIPNNPTTTEYTIVDDINQAFEIRSLTVLSGADTNNLAVDNIARGFLAPYNYSNPNRIKMVIPSQDVGSYQNKTIRIELAVRVKPGTNLLDAGILTQDGKVPNTATLSFDNKTQNSTVNIVPTLLRNFVFTKKLGSEVLGGANFKLYHVDADGGVGDPVYETFVTPQKQYSSTSDVDGSVRFHNVPAGTYWMVEEVAPAGTYPVHKNIKVVVKDANYQGSQPVEFQTEAGLPISATEVFNNSLVTVSGKKVWVGDEQTNLRPEAIKMNLFRKIGENGTPEPVDSKIVSDPWDYSFQDEGGSQKYPKYHPLTNEEYTYFVKEEAVPFYTSEVDGTTVTNTVGTTNLRLIKRDGDTGLPIEGTTFVLREGEDTEIEVKSDENGAILFENVKKGVHYSLFEKRTDFSEKYIYNSGVVSLYIDNDGRARFIPSNFPLVDPDDDSTTDNSGHLFLNYLRPVATKKVNGADSYALKSLNEEVEYSIEVPVKGTGDIRKFEISDTVDNAMQIVPNSVKITKTVEGGTAEDITHLFKNELTNSNRTGTLWMDNLTGDTSVLANSLITVTFKAKIILNPNNFVQMYPDKTVPNKAVLNINDLPENRQETNSVNIVADFTELSFTKKLAVQDGAPMELPPGVQATFRIEKIGDIGVFVPRELTTDENGKITISNLDVGEYLLKETKAPQGYLPVPEIFLEVTKDVDNALSIRAFGENGAELTIINGVMEDIVDPLPALPTINKMAKKQGMDMTADGGDYKHYDMATWTETFEYVVDITIPENVAGYQSLTFGDLLPVGLDIPGAEKPAISVGSGTGSGFSAEENQVPYASMRENTTISQSIGTRQYEIETTVSTPELISALAGKTIRYTYSAKINDSYNTLDQLPLANGNLVNEAWFQVNHEIMVESQATVKPAEQYGITLKKIADFKNNGEDVPLANATFILSKHPEGPALPEQIRTDYTTGNDGLISIENRLETGKYILTEAFFPNGYTDADGNFHPATFVSDYYYFVLEVGVDVPGGGRGVKLSGSLTPYDPNATEDPELVEIYTGSASEEYPAKVINRKQLYIPVSKVWEDANNLDNTRPETITLTLQRAIVNGEPDVLNPATGELQPVGTDPADTPDTEFNSRAATDSQLKIEVPVGSMPTYFSAYDLFRYTADGQLYNYYVLEESVEGYTATYSVKPTDPSYGEDAPAETVVITNTLNTTKEFALLKVDDSETPVELEGAVFNLTYTNAAGQSVTATKITDADGKISLAGLAPNKVYKLKEITAPAGYLIDKTEYTIVVDSGGDFTVYSHYVSADREENEEARNFDTDTKILTVVDKKPEVPVPVKKINGENSFNLPSLNTEFEYAVSVPVESVEGMTSFVIEDTVHDLLEIVPNSAVVQADGRDVNGGSLSIEGKKITFTLTDGFGAIENREVVLRFKAKVAQGKTLADLQAFVSEEGNTAGIPNEATVKINDKPSTSNTVYLVPGEAGAAPALDKKVNGVDHYDLVENSEIFRYTVTANVPENVLGYDILAIQDTLAKVLQVEGGVVLRAVEYNADGSEASSVTLVEDIDYTLTNTTNADPNASEDGTIVAIFSNYDFTKLADKTIVMEFDARIKTGVTAAQIADYTANKVPNIAEILLNGDDVEQKTVTITPPSDPTIDKKVNGVEDALLDGGGLADPINYTVEANVPFNVKGYNTFVISDQLSEVLTDHHATVTVDGGADADGHIVVDETNGLVTATITGNENIAKYAGKTIKLTINTKIDQTKDLSEYLVEGKLPNTAEVKINDQPKGSDTATVTPKVGEVNITKKLEGENSLWPTDEKAVFTLEKRVETEWKLVKSIEIDGFSPVTIGNLLPGTYRLTETSAPAGYLLADPQVFTITGSETVAKALTFTDTKVPGIAKAVDRGYFADFNDTRTFTITVPITSVEGMTQLVITDEVDDMFQIVAGSATATGGTTALSVQPVVNGQTITLTKTDDFGEIANKTIVLTFQAKLKAGFVYSELPTAYKAVGIPNKAVLVVNNGPQIESDEVRVQVPVGDVTLTKTADGASLPAGTGATFKLFVGTPGTGTEIGTFSTAKNGEGNDIIHVGDLAPGSYYFIETVAPQGYVLNTTPREFTIAVDSDGFAVTTAGANFTDFTVVNTKSEIPTPEKKVDGENHVDLTTFDKTFSYTVSVPVTKVDGWTEFTLTDQVDASLDVSNIKVTVDGTQYTPGTIDGGTFTAVNNLITFKFTQLDKVQALVGKTVVLTFDAKLNVTPEEFLAGHPDSIVRNTANLSVGNLSSTSNEVTVTPPAVVPTPVKSINGDTSETPLKLGEKDQKFFYDVRVQIPSNVTGYNKLVLRDALEPVLETSLEQIRVYVNDIRNDALKAFVTLDAATNTVALTIDNATLDPDFDFATLAGKTLRLEIEANFKAGVTAEQLDPYMTNGVATVPNKAQFVLNDQTAKDSNTVNVTPPGDEPTIGKTVDNEDELLLSSKDQEFTYRVNMDVPTNIEGYTNLTLEDTLEEVLEPVSTHVLVDGTPDGDLKTAVTNANNKVTLTITDNFAQYAGKSITLVIQAKIKDEITLDQIAHRYGNSAIPNVATLVFNGSPKTSNTVTVTPPSDISAPVKTVNAQNDIVLNNIRDEFVYNISYKIPTNITGFNTLVLTDVLEGVLQTEKAKIAVYVDEQVDNKLTEAVSVTGTGSQTVSLTINKGFLGGIFGNAFEDLAGKTVRVEIKATIRDGADLSGYADAKVPNTAGLQLNDNAAKNSNTVTVQPPKGNVILTKVVDGEPLSGDQTATFTLYKQAGAEPNPATDTLVPINGADATTVNATSNQLIVSGLEPGNYYFVETAAPAGYILNSTPIPFAIAEDQSIAVSLTWNNVSDLTPVKTVNDAKSIDIRDFGQEFTYKVSVPVGSVSAMKKFVIQDEVNALLTIVENSAKVYKQDGTVIAGNIAVSGNTITFTKTSDFTGMTNSLVTLEFKAKLKDGITVEDLQAGDTLTTGIPNKATLSVNDKAAVDSDTVYVKPVLGDVELGKTANYLALGTGQSAKFDLYKGTAPNGTKVGETLTTDANGKIIVTNLIPGSYYFVEVEAPVGYKLDAAPKAFTILGGEKVGTNPVSVLVNNESADLPTPAKSVDGVLALQLTSMDQEFTYKVEIPVTDVNGIDRFVIEDAVDSFLTIGDDTAKVSIGTAAATGTVEVDAHTITYTADAADIAAMAGRTVTLEFKATIKEGTTAEALRAVYDDLKIPNVATLTVNETAQAQTNTVTVQPQFGGVVLTKTIDNGQPLPKDVTATFALYRVTSTGDVLVKEYTTVNGRIEVYDLAPGNYKFVETTAPAGYEKAADKEFAVIAGAATQQLTVDNLPIQTSLEVRKDWVNGPETKPTVAVQLFRQVENSNKEFVGDAIELNATNSWTHTWTNLDTTDANGNAYIYTVDELNVPAGYSKEITGTGTTADPFVVSNVFGIPNGDITAHKKWVGGDSLERPTDIYFQLVINGVSVGNPKALGSGTEVTWESMPLLKEDGTPNVYTVKEVDSEGNDWTNDNYTVSYDGLVVTNTYQVTKTTATVEKVWDGGPADKPAVEVQLFRQIAGGNKEFVGSAVTLNGSETTAWTHTWTGLDKTNPNGEEYIYTVDELSVPEGYGKAITGNLEEGFVITNTFGIPTGDITAYKKWVGGDSLERPTDIYFQLVKDGVDEGDAKALGTETEVTWANMPLVNADGTAIVYTVKEVDSAGNNWTNDNYTVSYDGLVVTNTYQVAKTTTSVEKAWDGGPEDKPAVEVQLFRQVTGGNKEFVGDAIELNTTNSWKHTWMNLDTTDTNGNVYTYTVDELNVPAGYSKEITGTGTTADPFVITNTFGIPTGDITAYKKWVGGDSLERPTDIYFQLVKDGVDEGDAKALGTETEVTWANMPLVNADGTAIVYTVKEVKADGTDWTNPNYTVSYDGLVVTNTYGSETRDVYAKKIWSGGTQDSHVEPAFALYRNGTLVDDVTPTVIFNADRSEYSFVWPGLAANDAYGQVYSYTVVETGTYANYGKSAVTGDGKTATTAYTVTNTYNAPTTTHSFTKTWVNGPTVKPTIEIQLYQNDTAYGNKVALANGTMSYEWTNLPTTDADGNAYTYTVKELTVGGIEVANGVAGDYSVVEENNGTASTITNTYNVPKITLEGQKTWVGDGESSRPDSLTVELLRDGNPLNPAVTTTTDAEAGWEYSFADLDQTDAEGNAYTYTVRETEVPTGYEASYEGMNITNTYVGTTQVDITKVWVDNSNEDNTRPKQITLLAIRNDGQRYEKVFDVDNATDSKVYTIANLPKFDSDGNEYTYTVDEVAVAGYAKAIAGTTITNTLEGTIDIPYEKVWVGAPSTHPSIDVILLADGVEVDRATIENGDSLEGVFAGKPVYDNTGKKITYTVTEEISEDAALYNTESKLINGTWILTNTYSDTVDIPVTKSWQYADETPMPDDKIPANIDRVFVVLYRNDEAAAVKELTKANGWKATFEDLAKFDADGNAIAYRVEELPVDGFTSSQSTGTDGSVSIVNKKHDTPTMSIPVQKLWSGNKPTDIESITVVLTRTVNGVADDAFTQTLVIDGPEWNGEFTGLSREDADGNKYVYQIAEQPVPGYAPVYTGGGACGFVIHNEPTTAGQLSFTKLVANTTQGLAGAEFELRGITNPAFSMKAFSDADGKVAFVNVPFGKYVLSETKAPTGYETLTQTWAVVVDRDGNITIDGESADGFTVENSVVKGVVELTKTLEGKAPQSGQNAAFALYKVVGEIDSADNGETDDTKVGDYTTDNAGKIRVTDLEPGDYYFVETEAPTGYALNATPIAFTVAGTVNESIERTVDNVRETADIHVVKKWDGGSDRPDVQVQLFRQAGSGNKEIVGNAITLNEANEWKHTWEALERTDASGVTYTYTVDETAVPHGYTKQIAGTGSETDPFVITNTYGVTQADVTVTKEWIGGPTPRPVIELQLLRNIAGQTPQPVEGVANAILADGDVTYTWNNLDTTDENGVPYLYSVKEVTVPEGYEAEYDGLNVTNRFTALVGLQLLKTDEDGNPLSGAKFGLFDKQGTTLLQEKITLYDGKLLFDGLVPGEQYVLRETLAPEGYVLSNERYQVHVSTAGVVEVIGNSGVIDSNPLTLTNKAFVEPEPETTRVVVHKTWANLEPGDKPENHEATFTLQPTGAVKTIRGNGTAVFENLPKYDAANNLIEYTVTEKPLDGFETIVAGNQDDGFVFTNYPTRKFGVVLQKIDDRSHAVLPGAEFELWGKLKEETTTLSATLVLGEEVELAEPISVKLLKNGNDTGQSVQLDADHLKDEFAVDGEDGNYSVFIPPYSGLDIRVQAYNYGFLIHAEKATKAKTDATQTEALAEELQEQKIALEQLTQKGNTAEADDATQRIADWQAEIDELARATAPSVTDALVAKRADLRSARDVLEEEMAVADEEEQESLLAKKVDLEAEIDQINAELDDITFKEAEIDRLNAQVAALQAEIQEAKNNANEELEKEIANRSERIQELEALLEEADETDSKGSVTNEETLQLSQNNTQNVNGYVLIGKYATDEHGLIAVGDLEEGEYYFIETKAPEGYTGDLNKKHEFSVPDEESSSKPVTITVENTLTTPETVEYTVMKVWKGGPAVKPDIRIQLLQDGQNYGAPITLKDGESVYTWTNLPKYNGKELYVYTVKEVDAPNGYDVSVAGNIITNTWNNTVEPDPTDEYTTVSGKKNWVGDKAADRPASITVKLVNAATGEVVQTKRVTSSNGWTYVFENVLIKDADGNSYSYRVEEVVPEGYEASYQGYNITNTKKTTEPEPDPEDQYGTVSGKKNWVGDEVADRPASITVRLVNNATGEVVQTKTVTSTNGWTYVFENVLIRDADGNSYSYRVEEVVPEGYEATYQGYNITNTKKTTEPDPDPEDQYGTVSGKKNWVGDEAADRPASITVKLVNAATGEVVQTKTVTSSNGWTYVFDNVLIKDADGNTYSYRVEEVVPEGYEATYQGYNITNTWKGSSDPDDGTETPDPDDGTETPDPDDGTETPDPDDGTETPDPDDGTDTPDPDDGTETPDPDDGTETPDPDDGTEAPKPDDGTDAPKPDDGTDTPAPTKPSTPAPGKPNAGKPQAGSGSGKPNAGKPQAGSGSAKRSNPVTGDVGIGMNLMLMLSAGAMLVAAERKRRNMK